MSSFLDGLFGIAEEEAGYIAERNALDKTGGNYFFKQGLFELLPTTHSTKKKKDFITNY